MTQPNRQKYHRAGAHSTEFSQLQAEVGPRGFSKDALFVVEAYSWPGNVRELENKIKRTIVMCERS